MRENLQIDHIESIFFAFSFSESFETCGYLLKMY